METPPCRPFTSSTCSTQSRNPPRAARVPSRLFRSVGLTTTNASFRRQLLGIGTRCRGGAAQRLPARYSVHLPHPSFPTRAFAGYNLSLTEFDYRASTPRGFDHLRVGGRRSGPADSPRTTGSATFCIATNDNHRLPRHPAATYHRVPRCVRQRTITPGATAWAGPRYAQRLLHANLGMYHRVFGGEYPSRLRLREQQAQLLVTPNTGRSSPARWTVSNTRSEDRQTAHTTEALSVPTTLHRSHSRPNLNPVAIVNATPAVRTNCRR
jgi:hypothetical protein